MFTLKGAWRPLTCDTSCAKKLKVELLIVFPSYATTI